MRAVLVTPGHAAFEQWSPWVWDDARRLWYRQRTTVSGQVETQWSARI